MKLLQQRRTMQDVLGPSELPDHSTHLGDHTDSCQVTSPGGGDHIVITVSDGVTFDHACAVRRGGRVGLPALFNNGQRVCPYCGQTA